ncbi:phospholipase B1, membrane-associated [Eurytemora carolleeae]|uniref:phospholipase B1, membrane-associated n=1 Tax=Eurytemora carolleeae TaxID=1294199 RepID=UPI000C776F1F|nr:phospholipase B1, membrane-associated [Eurytemora carolleeae]|eukprot:XP_023322394.1 phospholipase B1, membrane-associated-like [Eurytemora affinis]
MRKHTEILFCFLFSWFGFVNTDYLLPVRFPCKAERSKVKPKNVNLVRPSDIDIIGALGDSDTAAFAARSNSLLDYMNEYPGVSYATGVDANFAANPTFANILRQFNPRLIGGSGESDGILPGFDLGLNVAVSGAFSSAIPEQARVLVDKIVDIPGWEWKWKIVTVYIGSNDICSGSCQGIFTGKQLHIFRKNYIF